MNTVFIVAPHFPPSALPPSQRVRLLTKHLYEFGWHPVVFTVDHYYREELADPWMLEIAGNEYEKIEVKCLDQRKTRKWGVGDLGLRMFPFLYFSLYREIRKRKPQMILYPVPPWYIMVMGPLLKRLSRVPFAVDFIDPWVYKVVGDNRKARISQWLAKRLEKFAVKRSDAIFAVSQGILDDLVARYPSIKSKPLISVPYGVEASDFSVVKISENKSDKILMRYTGAISEAMLPVVDVLFRALKHINETISLSVEFTGTSYAGAGLVKPVLSSLIRKHEVSSFVVENPARVGYREALELSMNCDCQILIGDTTPYYAASKLMGMVASGKPFIAIIHKDSFPNQFLSQLNYRYKCEFNISDLAEESTVSRLVKAIMLLISERNFFNAISIDNPILNKYSAYSMTKIFSETFEKIIHE